MSLSERLRMYAQQFEDQHAPENITLALREGADEIERLRAEVQTWVNHTKTAVWSDSEEVKMLTADNERLRDALLDIVAVVGLQGTNCGERVLKIARAALEAEGVLAKQEGK